MSDRMPKRSTVPLVCSFAFMGVWLSLSMVRSEPNSALVRHLGADSWEAFAAASPGAAELIAVAVRLFAVTGLSLIALGVVVTLTAFRDRARWAGMALWLWPACLLAAFALDMTGFPSATEQVGTLGILFVIAAVPAIVGLGLGVPHLRTAAAGRAGVVEPA
jgi:hypothetical protein